MGVFIGLSVYFFLNPMLGGVLSSKARGLRKLQVHTCRRMGLMRIITSSPIYRSQRVR